MCLPSRHLLILCFLPVLVLPACRAAATPTPTVVRPLPTETVAPVTASAAPATDPAAPTLSSTETAAPETAGLTLPDGYEATVLVEGLQGPTQMILGPDGRLWVAQLAGGENEGTGQVLALSLETGASVVLAEGLFKPTGLAVLNDTLWLVSGRDLLRAPLTLDAQAGIGEWETVLDDLPFNGRSNGTLTVTPQGMLLFETSGRRDGQAAAPGSATLWVLDPTDAQNPQPLATGLKGAYAHTFDAAGRLWTTEISDDPVNGEAPPDELNLVRLGSDVPNFGWPACFGNQQPAAEYGGTPERCAATQPPGALFPPRSTPVSVVASPWEPDTLLVALWGPVEPQVVRIPLADSDVMPGTAAVEPFIAGLEHPQSLLVLPDGSLLVSDFGTGTIFRVARRS